jgi:dimethylargininase
VLIALTREVSPNLGRCELTHVSRQPIDAALAAAQHRNYEDCLRRLGCDVRRLPPMPDSPDAVFVEDTCIVLDELAVITRPGAESRKPETQSVAEAVKAARPLRFIEPPATLDGGDVLCLEKQVFVGLSSRTTVPGIERLHSILTPHGYTVTAVDVAGCLHLKSAVTRVGEETLLVNRSLVEPGVFGRWKLLDVDPSEPHGANALLVSGAVIYPATCPKTCERLSRHGIRVEAVDVSELGKAEGGVTCCCLLVDVR